VSEIMSSQDLEELARNAKRIYEQRLRAELEDAHRNEFVAVEPISGDYFLGQSLSDAIGAAREAHPDRLVHTLRIGHQAAVHLGFGAL
jgi:hypothetical protein